jgi:signal transduction histidine kinase
MLIVVTLGIVLSGLAGAHFGHRWAQEQQEQSLRRMVTTLTDTVFPLNHTVLLKMRGLSGAEFALLDASSQPVESTIPISTPVLASLRRIPAADQWTELAVSPTVTLQGHTYRAGRLPLARRVSSSGPASLVVLYPEDRRWAAMRQVVYPSAVAGVVTALAAIGTTTVLARRFVRPIQRLRGQAAAIADGDFQPIDLGPRNDEIRDLGLSLNRMAEQLSRYENEVRRKERLRTLDQLGAGMAHQLRNAATGALMAIELHARECPQRDSSEALDVAIRQVKLMESYLQRFLKLGRPASHARTTLALGALVADTLDLVRPACNHGKIRLDYVPPPEELFVEGEAENLRQLVLNLLLNAIDAVGSRADPRIVVQLNCGKDRVAISVEDSGPGPDAAVAASLFEPFVTSKPEGTGLGLWVAREIAADHQGTITWRRDHEMTCFIVELPWQPLRDNHGTPACCG